MKQTFLVVGSLLAGFVGGVGSSLFTHASERPEQIVRARSFELVDDTGRVISFWGIDKNRYAVLAFGSNRPVASAGDHHALELHDPVNQRAAIGVIDDAPFLYFRAPDGEPRMSMSLSTYEKPILWMGDETGPRMWLGIQQSDTGGPEDRTWALNFGPEKAIIGMSPVEEGGQKHVKGIFSVSTDTGK